MAKATAINMSDIFTPSPTQVVITPNSTFGDFLPTLANQAAPASTSAGSGASKLSTQVLALSSTRDLLSSSSMGSARRPTGPTPPTDGTQSFLLSAKLPPLTPPSGPSTVTFGASVNWRAGTWSAGTQQNPSPSTTQNSQALQMEAIQPLTQHPAMLPKPTPATYPYQPKRKPPSAFMRNNPTRQYLEAAQSSTRSGSASSTRSLGVPYDPGSSGLLPDGGLSTLTYEAFMPPPPSPPPAPAPLPPQPTLADGVMALAQAAMAQGVAAGYANQQQLQQQLQLLQQQMQQQQQVLWAGEEGDTGTAVAGSAPPWGVSSVSDLEALDSILDQLVVVDGRMRRALLKGPLISFETVVPEHLLDTGRLPGVASRLVAATTNADDGGGTFLTSVKAGGEDVSGGEGLADGDVTPGRPMGPPSPGIHVTAEDAAAAYAAAAAAAANAAAAAAAASASRRGPEDTPEIRDTSLFPASIPNPGMHPTFTRAYIASKLTPKAQSVPLPPPATAEHLLRSRPPPFIAAPSYDQLCSQIRDVQRQYTCGTSRMVGSTGAGAAGAGAATSGGSSAPSAPPVTATINQYIAGLDGPTLEELVAHQELPISLERVRPTFVALKHKPVRGHSPRRRPGSPGRPQTAGEGPPQPPEANNSFSSRIS